MKRYGFLVSAMAVVALVFASLTVSSVGAAPDMRNYGPFHGAVSPDSGTCGNNWATDTFNRYFRVSTTQNTNGTYNVTEEYRAGTFETITGSSPGACESGSNSGATVADGVRGKFSGTLTIIVTGGTYNADAKPGPGTTTASFVSDVFGLTATYDTPAFSFEYSTKNNGSWTNSSAGNSGDITSTP